MKKLSIVSLILLSLLLGGISSCSLNSSDQSSVSDNNSGVVEAENTDHYSDFSSEENLEGVSAEQTKEFIQNFEVASALGNSPISLWFHTHASMVLPTSLVPRRQASMPLNPDSNPAIGEIRAETELGELRLGEFLDDERSYAQGFIVVHKGSIVYEAYPGKLHPSESHLTASTAKVFVSLLVERLIEEGVIDEQRTLGDYVPEFRDSVWEGIRVIDLMDMTTGLNPIDGPEHFANPDSVVARMLMAELGQPYKGENESLVEVLKEAEKVSEPGEYFTYSSTATQALVILTEAVTGHTWADMFDRYIWSKMGVDGPLEVHLSPEGIALGHGLLSLQLRDLARFGMLYTPSWSMTAVEPVVSDEILNRTRVPYRSREFYRNGPSGNKFMERLGDPDVRSAGRQWDAVWEDGDFFKSGLNTQGIYVSPDRDLVIAYFSVEPNQQIQKYLRPIVTSGLFD